MTKFLAKLTGTFKYFKYLGKLVQALKLLTNIIPQIMIFIPEENKAPLESLIETLDKVADAIEKAEKFLNKLGIDTSVEDETEEDEVTEKAPRTLEQNVEKLSKIARSFN